MEKSRETLKSVGCKIGKVIPKLKVIESNSSEIAQELRKALKWSENCTSVGIVLTREDAVYTSYYILEGGNFVELLGSLDILKRKIETSNLSPP